MSDETTTDRLAEIEGQADYTAPEGWRLLQGGEVLEAGDEIVQLDDGKRHPTYLVGCSVGAGQRYIRRIEPPPEPEPQPVHLQVMIDAQAETIARLNSEIHELNIDIESLETQLEAVKAELVQERLERNHWQNHAQRTETQLVEKISECRNLRIELDALQQAPQTEPVAAAEAVSDGWEAGWKHGKARAVETIAEWLEPIKAAIDAADNQDELARAGFFAIDTIRHLPAIMRSLTGLTDED